MKFALLAIWLVSQAIGAHADAWAFPYELITFYNAYLLDYKANGPNRVIGPGINHPLPAGASAAETAFHALCEDDGIAGAAPFDQFVKALAVPGSDLNKYKSNELSIDPKSIEVLQKNWLTGDPAHDDKKLRLHYSFNVLMPSLFDQLDPSNVNARREWNHAELFRHISDTASSALMELHEAGTDTQRFTKETAARYAKALNTASMMRQYAHAPEIIAEANGVMGTNPQFRVFGQAVSRTKTVTIPAYDDSVEAYDFQTLNTDAIASTNGADFNLKAAFLQSVYALANGDLGDATGKKKRNWVHGNIIMSLNDGLTDFREAQAQTCNR